jgi:2-methylisocitrate lyase-like PEP mutase family enzyme
VAAIKRRSPELFVNARVDTYWLDQDATLAATAERADRHVDASADGIFVPGASAPDVLRKLTVHIERPLNALAIPGLSLAELAGLAVRRVSAGSLPYRAATYPELQDRLAGYADRLRR